MRKRLKSVSGGKPTSDRKSPFVFQAALEENLDGLYRYALRLAGQPSDAEDLLQETALRAFDRQHQLRDPSAFKPWIFQIMTHLYYNLYRQKKARPESTLDFEDWESTCSDDRAQADLFAQAVAEELREAVRGLPEAYRLPLWLGDIEGFQHKEIAKILEIPMGSVASKIHRGRECLRRKLSGEGSS